MKCGGLLITSYDPDQGSRILQLRSFLEDRVTAEPAERQETCEGLAYASSLTGVPDDELIVELRSQGLGVRRLRAQNEKPNPGGIRLKFFGKTPPSSITAGFQDITIRPWLRSPMLCRHCAKYGHTARNCRTQKPRCLRCSGEHPTPDCDSDRRHCPH